MADIKFFKSWVPRAGIGIKATGKVIKWDTIDHTVGYYATSDAVVITELELCIAGERNGVLAITEEEYNREFLSKKNLSEPLRPLWREEMSAGSYTPDTVGGGVTPTPFTSTPPAPAAPAATSAPPAPAPAAVAPEPKTARKGSVQ